MAQKTENSPRKRPKREPESRNHDSHYFAKNARQGEGDVGGVTSSRLALVTRRDAAEHLRAKRGGLK